jgi:hypothetical protein
LAAATGAPAVPEIPSTAAPGFPRVFLHSDTLSIQYPRLSAENRLRVQPGMLANPDLTTDDRARSHSGTPGNSSLCGDDGVFAYFHVVRNLYQIVDFCSTAYHRGFKRSTVDARVGANFDVSSMMTVPIGGTSHIDRHPLHNPNPSAPMTAPA